MERLGAGVDGYLTRRGFVGGSFSVVVTSAKNTGGTEMIFTSN